MFSSDVISQLKMLSAILVLRKLICIYQIAHMCLYLFTSNAMSRALKCDGVLKVAQSKKISKETTVIVFPESAKSLEG